MGRGSGAGLKTALRIGGAAPLLLPQAQIRGKDLDKGMGRAEGMRFIGVSPLSRGQAQLGVQGRAGMVVCRWGSRGHAQDVPPMAVVSGGGPQDGYS